MIILQASLGFVVLTGVFYVLYLTGRIICAYIGDRYVLDVEEVEDKVLYYLAYSFLGALAILILLFIFGICMKIGQVFL